MCKIIEFYRHAELISVEKISDKNYRDWRWRECFLYLKGQLYILESKDIRKGERLIIMSKRSNGEGTLRKRKDGRWEGRYNAGVDENGKKKVKYILAKSQAECKEKLRAAIAEYNEEQATLARCDFLNNLNPTLKEWSEIWLENFCKAAVRQGTYENYKFFFRTYINPSLGNIELKACQP